MKKFYWLLALAGSQNIYAQIGGNSVFEFLRLSPSARVTALGGSAIATKDDDIALAYSNPALLNTRMHNSISFNQDIHPSGVSFGYLGYGYHLAPAKTTLQAGIQYINYGKFNEATADGEIVGTFRARETALNVGAGRQLTERLSVGINAKFVMSNLASYSSNGIAFDIGGTYEDTARAFVAAVTFRNFGSQFVPYTKGNFEPLPFEIQAAFSKRLKYLPLRFSIVGQQLQRWKIRYDDPALRDDQTILTGSTTTTSTNEKSFGKFVDNFFRHFIFNAELLIGKKEVLRLRLGYNYLRSAELRVTGLRSLSGFTAGFGIKVSKFRIDYGFGSYHFAGAAHHFTLSTNINQWIKSK